MKIPFLEASNSLALEEDVGMPSKPAKSTHKKSKNTYSKNVNIWKYIQGTIITNISKHINAP
mgnify:CR=1 FL=1